MKGGIYIEIKIIGSNSRNGMRLKKEVMRAIEEAPQKIIFRELNDEKSKKRYGVKNVPALISLIPLGIVISSKKGQFANAEKPKYSKEEGI